MNQDGKLRPGRRASFVVVVVNKGTTSTDQPVTVINTLPDGLVFDHARGRGWSCRAEGQTLICERARPLHADRSTRFEVFVGVQVLGGSLDLRAALLVRDDAVYNNVDTKLVRVANLKGPRLTTTEIVDLEQQTDPEFLDVEFLATLSWTADTAVLVEARVEGAMPRCERLGHRSVESSGYAHSGTLRFRNLCKGRLLFVSLTLTTRNGTFTSYDSVRPLRPRTVGWSVGIETPDAPEPALPAPELPCPSPPCV